MYPIYKHYKNKKKYVLITIAESSNDENLIPSQSVWHTESNPLRKIGIYVKMGEIGAYYTKEKTDIAIYVDIDGKVWGRPKKMFFGKVRHGRKIVQRFMPIG
jgi:hypothetical protein